MSVQDPRAAMRAFARECKFGPGAVKLSAPLEQFLDSLWAFLDEHASGFRIDDSVTRIDGVLKMQADLIFIAERHRDSALRILSCRFGEFLLREHEHTAGFRERNGGA